MASNPMQRKARNSFILGMFLMLIITGAIIAFLLLQIKTITDKNENEKKSEMKVCVLSQDVKSGQVITKNMLQEITVNSNTVPNNAIGDVGTLEYYSLQDKEGHSVESKSTQKGTTLFLKGDEFGKDGEELKKETTVGENGEINYYYEKNGEKKYVQLNSIPVLAKVSMQANTIITRELITKGNNTVSDDVRKQEYNVVVLPTQIQTGDYIDIRLSMPTGEDYIVVSKKEVEIPSVGSSNSKNTIWVNLSEQEILAMNSAIMDAFKVEGSKLYATTYTEPGIQVAATPTYVINSEVIQLIVANPNILTETKNALNARYSSGNLISQRDKINDNIQNNIAKADENVKTKMQESIQSTQEERQQYLDSLTKGAKASASTSAGTGTSTTATTTNTASSTNTAATN